MAPPKFRGAPSFLESVFATPESRNGVGIPTFGGRISGSDFSNTDPTVERRGCSSTGKFLGAKKMWHSDSGTAFAAEALTGLAGQGLQGASPRIDPAAQTEDDEVIEQFEGEQQQEEQAEAAATQGTAPAWQLPAVPAAARALGYPSAQDIADAIHNEALFPSGTTGVSDEDILSKLAHPSVLSMASLTSLRTTWPFRMEPFLACLKFLGSRREPSMPSSLWKESGVRR